MIAKKAPRKKWGDPGSKVARKTEARVFSQGAPRTVIVAIYPDGVIGLRLSKHRREEFVHASDVYRQAVMQRMVNERLAKRKAKKGARA
jgi:hypothetical protein